MTNKEMTEADKKNAFRISPRNAHNITSQMILNQLNLRYHIKCVPKLLYSDTGTETGTENSITNNYTVLAV